MAELTPMMQQYMETKKQYPDCILFYRLGDFYEMFFEDALTASRELEITLTGKNCGQEERAPMCGVPYHAVEGYLSRLVSKGYKVAICEQMEDPKLAKGLVKREVVRIVTPGTNLNIQALEENKNNYIMCIAYFAGKTGISVADVTTGDYYMTEVEDNRKLLDEVMKYAPSEIICNDAFLVSGMELDDLKERLGIAIYSLEPHYFDDDLCRKCLMKHFGVNSLSGLGVEEFPNGVIAAGSLLSYLYDTQKIPLSHFTHIEPYLVNRYMLLDSSTRRNLELTETLREKQKRGSLLWVLDKTRTAMGARMLRSFLEQPLIHKNEMEERLDAVEAFCSNPVARDEIREYLNPIYDLERLLGKVSYKTANPRDLIAFRNSMEMLPHIKTVLKELPGTANEKIEQEMDGLEDLYLLICDSIEEEPPITIREGGMIKAGYNEDIDNLRRAKTEGKNWLAELENAERERTGIKNLRVKYNKVFGYYLEVTKSYLNMVPEDYIRKQTLTNAERYTLPRLKELEDTILNAEDKLCTLEYDLFCEIRDRIAGEIERIQTTAKAVARLDVFCSFSLVAEQNHYVRPVLNEKGQINIKDGRHPVVEKMIEHDMFIPNDTYLDNNSHQIAVITGPNMAGKSTYMRQTALIVLMAQVGSFVPARQAAIGIVDRIFTRVGASDDLASGQSTFMVEMSEVANILRNATRNSLLILDEIGRGTSTFDGLSIAWAVIEHISNRKLLGAKTLFATHYHELTELEGKMNNVNNYCIAVKEKGDDIVFLRKIIKGGADKSYGIQVARLAGVPDMVIDRAKEIVEQLSDNDITEKVQSISIVDGGAPARKQEHYDELDLEQISLFDTVTDADVLDELKNVEVSTMTPLDALNTLYRLQNKLKNRW
ncbi:MULTISPECIES: DNA mismatch repair protein MutS [Eisenbergiella]|uniref:DNA mismatch repair protein MutS n=2 Tax=Eisenbergiella porci TaxID=2652274 RepID=A0A6N7WHM6_9FIRM|nr:MULTISPECIES: DNA mismatch repair protein MutS [Eisenbergiella]MDY2652144.1 DNA mismatch repair protein MutS [Eisenbergiella porci]MSS88910.1 DNA mismatch repair protein MutS [Eisenbergiella porci]